MVRQPRGSVVNVIAEMPMPVLLKGKEVIECPVCGQYDDLILVVDSQDFSESASLMKCDDGHQWAEPRVPRRLGAELLQRIQSTRPESIDWTEVREGGAGALAPSTVGTPPWLPPSP